jgi:purine-nucleoside phosphorylase
MPLRLRPSASIAADAVLVGDPGRALMLAQALLEEPKMSNHARGLWGYTGRTLAGDELTIQATGMGGPSASLVLTDLAELGVRRAIRVGTCTALDPGLVPGDLLAISEAHAWSGPGGKAGERVFPDPGLAARLRQELGAGARQATVASLDSPHTGSAPAPVEAGDGADMQTAALLARGVSLGIAVAAVLVVSEAADGMGLDDQAAETAAQAAGRAAAAVFSG